MKNIRISFSFAVLLTGMALYTEVAFAQQTEKLTLEKATSLALQNNRLLTIKTLQVSEKQQKVNEDKVKFYPSVTVASTYQYNTNLGSLTIPQGSFGALPLNGNSIALPSESKTFELGQHHLFNVGLQVYQPISQFGKINTGMQVSKTDVQIAEQEKAKATLQVKQAVEKVYFGLLIAQKQKEEASLKLEVAKAKLYDVESALQSGKTIQASKVGLLANVADEEQNLLKISNQMEDYTADLKRLTGQTSVETFELEPISLTADALANQSLEQYQTQAASSNTDIKIATLTKTKTDLGVQASRFSNLPDLGLIGGYTYQKGNLLFPAGNGFAGISFRWNIQDLTANRFTHRQRTFLQKQAEENIANTREQVQTDVEKAYRKVKQSTELLQVAQKVVNYRKEEYKIQEDRQKAGLNLKADLLSAQATLAKAETDLFAAQLSYRLALTDLQIATGTF